MLRGLDKRGEGEGERSPEAAFMRLLSAIQGSRKDTTVSLVHPQGDSIVESKAPESPQGTSSLQGLREAGVR